MRKVIKALVLFSGGLDSMLAVKILKKQGIRVTGLTFKSYFFDADLAKKAAKHLKIPLKIIDFSKEHLKMVKSPKYGYGKSMNPCIDCHILMLKKAKDYYPPAALRTPPSHPKRVKQKVDFIATGEVLGERPMSQNKKALELIKKESSLKGYLLRPLSAQLLEPTIPEKKGLINRKNLLDISGRSRKRQKALAKKYKIWVVSAWHPTPAGGCLLTDLEFGKRLKELFETYHQCNGNDIELLKLGRHFSLPSAARGTKEEAEDWVKIIVGRNETENKEIEKLAKPSDILIEMKNYPGPLTLVRNYDKTSRDGFSGSSQKVLEEAKKLTQYYYTRARNKKDVKFKMVIKSDKKNLKETIKITLKFLNEGKLIVSPTDTVYGLICDATNKKAVEKLFKIKKRPKGKPIPIFVKNIEMAKQLAFIDKTQEKFLKKVWPGKVTVILKRKKRLPDLFLDNQKTIGLRIPDYKLINELLKRLNNPITGTSANISGKPASTKIKEVTSQFENQKIQPDLIIDTGDLKKSKPSTVIDLTGKKSKILRRGEVKIKH